MTMEPSSYRSYGWFYTIMGGGLFVGALLILLEPNPTKIYLGALVGGPILFIRGVNLLIKARELGTLSDYDKGVPDAIHPAGLNLMAIRHANLRLETACESCGAKYLYFPEMTPKSTTDVLATGQCVAPCPQCGWIQRSMLVVARKDAPGVMLIGLLGVIVLFLAAMFFCYIWTADLAGNAAKYWIAFGLLILAGAALLVWATQRENRWDPNSQPQSNRLAIAGKLCMPRERFEVLIDTEQVPREVISPSHDIKRSKSQDIK